MRFISPAGDEEEGAITEVVDEAEKEKAEEETDSDGNQTPEEWKEVKRVIEEVDLENSGTTINRIIRTRFEKPNGRQIELVFAEAQGIDADTITETA